MYRQHFKRKRASRSLLRQVHIFGRFLVFSVVGPPGGTSEVIKGLEKVSEGVLGALREAVHSFFWRPRAPKEGLFDPQGLPRRVRSVFENVKKQLVFIAFLAMWRPHGRPQPPLWKFLPSRGDFL